MIARIIDLDITGLPLADFMRAMGYEPTRRDGNRLTYVCPYSAGGSIVVDTDKNTWYDSDEPKKCYGGIYDLAYEITGSCNRSELNLFIASEMKKIMKTTKDDRKINLPKHTNKNKSRL